MLTYQLQVEPSTMLFRNKVSPYQNKTLKGVVRETWLRGQRIFSREDGFTEKTGPSGKLLLEQRT
jgi:allantoinase